MLVICFCAKLKQTIISVVHLGRTGHGRPGRVLGHEGAVHAHRRRLPGRVLGDGPRVLRPRARVSGPHPQGEGGAGRLSGPAGSQQGGSGPAACGERAGRQGHGSAVWGSLHRDQRQGPAAQRGQGVPGRGEADQEAAAGQAVQSQEPEHPKVLPDTLRWRATLPII